jgi:hypothetical protein
VASIVGGGGGEFHPGAAAAGLGGGATTLRRGTCRTWRMRTTTGRAAAARARPCGRRKWRQTTTGAGRGLRPVVSLAGAIDAVSEAGVGAGVRWRGRGLKGGGGRRGRSGGGFCDATSCCVGPTKALEGRGHHHLPHAAPGL